MKITTLILSITITANSFASNLLFNQANELYSKQKYNEAIVLYDSILTTGMESSELYYNLGNCYFKNQDWANTIWNYEKSLKLKSNKKTLQNLILANQNIIDKIEPLPEIFYVKWWNNTINILNTKDWQILTIIFIWISLFLLIANQFKFLKNKHFFNLIFFISILLIFISNTSFNKKHMKKEGVIFSSPTNANSAPSSNSKNLFNLHSGVKFTITDSIGDWVNIELKNGETGWIKKSNYKTL